MTASTLNPAKPPRTGPIPATVRGMTPPMHDKILIVDFGSQVTQLIARRVREERVYCEIVPYQKAEAAFRGDEAEGGDPVRRAGLGARQGRAAGAARRSTRPACRCSASATASRRWRTQLGGKVEGGHHREFGRAEVEVVADSPLFEGVWRKGEKYPVWMSHGDRVTNAAAGLPACSAPRPTRRSPSSATTSANSTPPNSISK